MFTKEKCKSWFRWTLIPVITLSCAWLITMGVLDVRGVEWALTGGVIGLTVLSAAILGGVWFSCVTEDYWAEKEKEKKK